MQVRSRCFSHSKAKQVQGRFGEPLGITNKYKYALMEIGIQQEAKLGHAHKQKAPRALESGFHPLEQV